MNASLVDTIESTLRETLPESVDVDTTRSVGGGCINEAFDVRLQDGRRFFVKANSLERRRMFETEVAGLTALADSKTIRIPEVVAQGECVKSHRSFLVLEWIESGRAKPSSDFDFGASLARLHQASSCHRFGFDSHNFLGSADQSNSWRDDWVEFWCEERLGFQFRWAQKQGYGNREFNRLAEQVLANTSNLIAEPNEPPSLIHGDLWSGNYLYDTRGSAVIFDPAVYYGRREAELAMTRLFGGFGADFYRGYEEIWPLAEGSERRIEFYQLYHILNHLNLFGASYLQQALGLMERYAGRS